MPLRRNRAESINPPAGTQPRLPPPCPRSPSMRLPRWLWALKHSHVSASIARRNAAIASSSCPRSRQGDAGDCCAAFRIARRSSSAIGRPVRGHGLLQVVPYPSGQRRDCYAAFRITGSESRWPDAIRRGQRLPSSFPVALNAFLRLLLSLRKPVGLQSDRLTYQIHTHIMPSRLRRRSRPTDTSPHPHASGYWAGGDLPIEDFRLLKFPRLMVLHRDPETTCSTVRT